MGAFSWCTSDTKKSIPCCIPFGDLPGTVYLLNPFGEPYKETDYEGYGEFGGRDVYELVVEWNREYLSPDHIRSLFGVIMVLVRVEMPTLRKLSHAITASVKH